MVTTVTKGHKMIEFQKLFKALMIIFLPVFLVLKQPNLGTTVIMLFTVASIIFTTIIKISHLVVFGTLGVLVIRAIWPSLRPYHKQRILSLLVSSVDSLGIGYNGQQSQIAIVSGGFLAYTNAPEAVGRVDTTLLLFRRS